MKTLEETIKQYERYLVRVASSFNQDEYKDDLISEGRIAIMDAYNKYDESKGEFHPYCISYLKGRMKSFLTKYSRTIRIPANQQNEKSKYFNNTKLFKVDMIITDDEGKVSERDFIDEVDDDSIDDQEFIRNTSLTNAISNLKEIHQDLISMRYIEEKTLKQIADELGVTRQGVEQMLKTAIKNIKKQIKG